MSETLVDKIVQSIHEDIISLNLQPGQRLHIAELAKHYEVGPGPIREALSRLSSTELVLALSQRGFRVSPMSHQDLIDVYHTRTEIEVIALRLAIKHGDDLWEANILSCYHLLAKFESHPMQSLDDYKEWEVRHRAFNQAMLNACGLSHLLKIQEHLFNLTQRYRRQWLLLGVKQSAGLSYAKEQKHIMDAAIARNESLATELLRQHFAKAIQTISGNIQKE